MREEISSKEGGSDVGHEEIPVVAAAVDVNVHFLPSVCFDDGVVGCHELESEVSGLWFGVGWWDD